MSSQTQDCHHGGINSTGPSPVSGCVQAWDGNITMLLTPVKAAPVWAALLSRASTGGVVWTFKQFSYPKQAFSLAQL